MKRITREDLYEYRHPMPYAEQLYAPQYDYQLVDSVQAFMTFFATPIGQCIGHWPVRTQRDTSMVMGNTFPMGRRFLLTGVRVLFIPDCLRHRNIQSRDREDADAMLLGGSLRLRIQNREYLNDGPLVKFPSLLPRTWMGELRFESDEDEEAHWRTVYDPALQRMAGMSYYKIIPLFIQAGQFFDVQVSQDQTRPLHATGKLGVILDGHMICDTY